MSVFKAVTNLSSEEEDRPQAVPKSKAKVKAKVKAKSSPAPSEPAPKKGAIKKPAAAKSAMKRPASDMAPANSGPGDGCPGVLFFECMWAKLPKALISLSSFPLQVLLLKPTTLRPRRSPAFTSTRRQVNMQSNVTALRSSRPGSGHVFKHNNRSLNCGVSSAERFSVCLFDNLFTRLVASSTVTKTSARRLLPGPWRNVNVSKMSDDFFVFCWGGWPGLFDCWQVCCLRSRCSGRILNPVSFLWETGWHSFFLVLLRGLWRCSWSWPMLMQALPSLSSFYYFQSFAIDGCQFGPGADGHANAGAKPAPADSSAPAPAEGDEATREVEVDVKGDENFEGGEEEALAEDSLFEMPGAELPADSQDDRDVCWMSRARFSWSSQAGCHNQLGTSLRWHCIRVRV